MTYAGVDVLFVAMSGAVFAWAVARASHRGPFALAVAVTAVVLVVLTVVFDTVMIRADLFRYGAHALVGLRVGDAPVEDLAWPVAAALLVPSVAVLLGSRTGARAPAGTDAEGVS
jgi:lycopene cyclase domain-containing protein